MHISDGVFIMSIGSEARFLAVDDAEKKKKQKKKRKAEDRAAMLCIEGLLLGAAGIRF